MMKNRRYLWNALFTCASFELFFVILDEYKKGDASYRSRYRIVLAGDNSLSPRSNRCTSEGVTKLYDDVTKTYLKSHDIVTLHCIVGDIVMDFPLDLRVRNLATEFHRLTQKKKRRKRILSFLSVSFSVLICG